MRGASIVAASALLVLPLLAGGGQAAASDARREADDFSHYLGFIARAPLNSEQQARVEAETQEQMRSRPGDVRSADAQVRDFLASVNKSEDWQKARTRMAARFAIEKLPATDPIRQIVDQADPVVVADSANKWLVTEGTLTAWRDACNWMANLLSVPGANADFVGSERAYLKQNYAALPKAQQEQIVYVESNYPVTVLMIDGTDPAKRAEFIRRARPAALDREQFPTKLAELMDGMEHAWFHQRFFARVFSHTVMSNEQSSANQSLRVLWSHQPIQAPMIPAAAP